MKNQQDAEDLLAKVMIADRLTLPTLGTSLLFLPFLGVSSALAVLTNTFGVKMRTFCPASMLSFLNIASQEGILPPIYWGRQR